MLKPQCVSTSLRLRLYSPREWIQKTSERQGGGGTDRYKDMKRGRHTRRKEKDLLPCLKNKTKDFNLTARKRQPLLIESGMENRNRSLKCGGTATLWPQTQKHWMVLLKKLVVLVVVYSVAHPTLVKMAFELAHSHTARIYCILFSLIPTLEVVTTKFNGM